MLPVQGISINCFFEPKFQVLPGISKRARKLQSEVNNHLAEQLQFTQSEKGILVSGAYLEFSSECQ